MLVKIMVEVIRNCWDVSTRRSSKSSTNRIFGSHQAPYHDSLENYIPKERLHLCYNKIIVLFNHLLSWHFDVGCVHLYRTVYCALWIDCSSTYSPKHFIQMGAACLSGQSEGCGWRLAECEGVVLVLVLAWPSGWRSRNDHGHHQHLVLDWVRDHQDGVLVMVMVLAWPSTVKMGGRASWYACLGQDRHVRAPTN